MHSKMQGIARLGYIKNKTVNCFDMTQENSRINFTALEANQNIAARNYWKSRMEGLELSAYFDGDDTTVAADGGYRECRFQMPPSIIKWIETVATSGKARHVLLLASLGILINKYSGLSDIVVFTPGYITDGVKDSPGNIVPVRMKDLFNKRFKDALLQVKEVVVQDMQFSNYPIEKKLTYQFADNRRIPATGLVIDNIQDAGVMELFNPDMLFCISGSFCLTVRANAGFSDQYLSRIRDGYFKILETIAQDPLINISSINLFSETDIQQWVHEYNNTQVDYPRDKTIVDLLEEQAAGTPDNVAILTGNDSVSYRQLQEQSGKIAVYLTKERGIKKGDRVGILLDRQPLLIPVIIGILKSGAAYVPVDPQYPRARIQSIVEDAGIKTVITTATYQQTKLLTGIPVTNLDEIRNYIEQQPVKKITSPAKANDLAYIIYTSGSTGKPKGVMIEHRSLVNYIHWASLYYVRGEAATFPLYTSISFDLTVTSIFTPLVSGNAIIIYPEKDKEILVDKVFADNIATVIKLTPSHLKIIRDHPEVKWNAGYKKKKLIVGGENLESQLAKSIYDKFNGNIEIYNEYGPTEATVGCMIYCFNPGETRFSVPVGKPIANNRLYIFNRHLQMVPPGVWGELYIGGDGLARGYINNDLLTSERFIKNPYVKGERIYKTGDIARRLENGNIEYAGRVDEQVKIRGYRIEPGEIEQHLNRYELIRESVVVIREKGNSKSLVAYYVAASTLDPTLLRKYLLEHIPAYMVPSLFVHLQQLPLNANGKLDRKSLPEPGNAGIQAYVAPSDAIEEKLAELWAEVLEMNKDEISIKINFFELGGDSISILKLNSKINEQFQCNIPVADMFMMPTIIAMRKVIKDGVQITPQTDMIEAGEDRESVFINRAS